MLKFNIADILFDVKTDNPYKFDKFTQFSSSCKQKADMEVSLIGCNHINRPAGALLLDDDIKWIRSATEDKFISALMYTDKTDTILSRLDVDPKWSYASIIFSKTDYNGEDSLTGPLGQILFRNKILFHMGLVVHASAIECMGTGILFSAPSGTGKSTQAQLWKTIMGADILNGDRPAVRVIDNKPYVYGTPWSGSSSEFINKSAPLAGIVMLEQSPENAICVLSSREAVSRLMPRCFLPYHDSLLMDIAISNLEKIIASTPVFLLKCRPDREAVELVYKSIFKSYMASSL